MKNNFDLRKFLAEGSFANRPKQINEDFEEDRRDGEQQLRRYGNPCEKLENELMDLYDKHGDELLNFIERLRTLKLAGNKRGMFSLGRSFKNFIGFSKMAIKHVAYDDKGCGKSLQFFADYMGADWVVDFMESPMDENVEEGEKTDDPIGVFKYFFGLKEGDYNEGEYNEETEEEVNESAADVQELIIGLLGTGGMAAATIGISKLMDALESGQHGEHGKKVAQALKKLGNAAAKSRNVSEEEVEESAPGYAHDCAAHVVHEVYGYGLCLEGQHTLVETTKGRAKVTHYDVLFKNGTKIVENIPVEELQIESIEEHTHSKKK